MARSCDRRVTMSRCRAGVRPAPPGLWFFLLLVFGLPPTAASQPPCNKGWPWIDDLHVAGRIGNREVRGYLGEAFATADRDGLFGVFFYPAAWTPASRGRSWTFAVDGTFAHDCSATLTEINDAGEPQATWQLAFVANAGIEGRRQDSDGSALPISLAIVRPVDCSGQGPWRTFSSSRWPVTFSYPSSWRLAEEGNAITLICPDPSRLAFGGLPIVLTKDAKDKKIETADGRSGRSIAGFTTFDNRRWLIGECDDQPPEGPYGVFCQPARRSTRRNMTVLQGWAGEHRLYRFGGGYVGQGGGVAEYVFFVGERRVGLRSADAPIVDRLESQGPVLFEGDDVTARLVRSIRPR